MSLHGIVVDATTRINSFYETHAEFGRALMAALRCLQRPLQRPRRRKPSNLKARAKRRMVSR